MNERISGVSNICCNCDSDKSFMGRRRLDREKKLKDEKEKFETYFKEALKNIKEDKQL